jgi:hypothetical protein
MNPHSLPAARLGLHPNDQRMQVIHENTQLGESAMITLCL